MKSLIRVVSFFMAALLAAAVVAQSQPITVNTVAEKEESYTDSQGVQRTRLVPAITVIPGDQVVYTINFANTGDLAAEGIKIVDPIPEQMRYVANSAFGPGTTISFSADGGKSFAAADAVMVTDGANSRVASPSEYTHIQWVFNRPLEPKSQAYAQFKAVLK